MFASPVAKREPHKHETSGYRSHNFHFGPVSTRSTVRRKAIPAKAFEDPSQETRYRFSPHDANLRYFLRSSA